MSIWLGSLQSGSIACLMAIIATVLVERCGGRIGGIIATMPFTFLPASFVFVEDAKTDIDWKLTLFSLPGGGIGSICFLEVWNDLPALLKGYSEKWKLVILSVVSCLVWFIVCFLFIYFFFMLRDHPSCIIPVGLILDIFHLLLATILAWYPSKSMKGKKKPSILNYLSRGVLAFIAIFFASAIAKSGNLIFAAVCSLAPAIYLTTMLTMWISHGEDVCKGAIKPMMLGWNAYI